MNQLYRHKWVSTEGRAINDSGDPSANFKLWMRKLSRLSKEEIVIGVEHCEQLVSDAANSGGESWPPTYAQFIGYCQVKEKPKQPTYAAHKQFKVGLPESKEHRKERNKKGIAHCERLLDILSE